MSPGAEERGERAKRVRQTTLKRNVNRRFSAARLRQAWSDLVVAAPLVGTNQAAEGVGECRVPAFAREIHPTHRIVACGGVLACTACGCAASVRARPLLQQCRGEIARGSGQVMKSLAKGKLPAKAQTWPDGIYNGGVGRQIFRLPSGEPPRANDVQDEV